MMYINLLPWREERDALIKQQFVKACVLSAVLGAVFIVLWLGGMFGAIERQDSVNAELSAAIKVQDAKIAEIKDLKDQIQVLVSRKKVVENLQSNRNQATHVFDQLGKRLPDGVTVKSIKEVGPKIVMVGVALNNTLVSKTMSSLESSTYFTQPVLIEIRATDVKSASGSTIKASEFILEFNYNNPEAIVEKTPNGKKK